MDEVRALIIVDVQNDFCPGGALAVEDGDKIIGEINRLRETVNLVVLTQDWHPEGHGSFASTHETDPFTMGELDGQPQVMWPDHCVQGTPGAEFHKDLIVKDTDKIFQKGMDPKVDSYSGFYDNNGKNSSGLAEYLHEKGVTVVDVCGLATDYCVKFTALDAIKEGFRVILHESASKGVGQNEDDIDNAIEEMNNAGATIMECYAE